MTVNRFSEHPNSVGETYPQHLRAALGYSYRMFRAAACCAIHGLFPWLCTTSGSNAIRSLHAELEMRSKPASERLAADQPAL